jgi:glycopeptide antibiotics resistance protein
MKNKTLLILAAGMGSRFGGLKQLEPFGPNGEFIIDYSIYDAVKCGFNKIVFSPFIVMLPIIPWNLGSRCISTLFFLANLSIAIHPML